MCICFISHVASHNERNQFGTAPIASTPMEIFFQNQIYDKETIPHFNVF